MTPNDLSYAAALIDTLAVLKTRSYHGTDLPVVVIQGRYSVLPWLADLTGIKLIKVERDYKRHLCADHCPEKHDHVVSSSMRWQLVGARATIVLHNLAPLMHMRKYEAIGLVELGRTIGYKGNAVNDMRKLGWEIPDLRPQPRARVNLVS